MIGKIRVTSIDPAPFDWTLEPITPERLKAIGFMTDDEKAAGEYVARIVGGSDDGWKQDSDADDPNDEIAEMTLYPVEDSEVGAWGVFVETYHATTLNVVSSVELGTRKTMAEILWLCWAMKAWAIVYPDGFAPPSGQQPTGG